MCDKFYGVAKSNIFIIVKEFYETLKQTLETFGDRKITNNKHKKNDK